MTAVPAPSRAGSSTTMSGRPSADSTSAGVTSPSRTRRLGKVAPLCRASAQAPPVPLDGQDRARRAHRLGQGDGEQAGAGVEVHHRCPLAVADQVEDRRQQRRRGAGVDLPEDPGRDPVGATVDGGMHGTGRAPDLPADHHAGAEVGQARRRSAAAG